MKKLLIVFWLLLFSLIYINCTQTVKAELKKGTTGEDIVRYAKKFVGNKYVYGGLSLTNGIDCSGFSMKVYEHFGVTSLPHCSHDQGGAAGFKKIHDISQSNLKPGDILYYTHGHIAIYAGDGYRVHAWCAKAGIVCRKDYKKSDLVYAIRHEDMTYDDSSTDVESNKDKKEKDDSKSNSTASLTQSNRQVVNGAILTSGYYDEEALSNYLMLNEGVIEDLMYADKDILEADDPDAISALDDWKMNIDAMEQEGGLLYYVRSGVAFVGILLSIWSILLYIAYWFDRINTIFYIDLIGKLSLGRLVLSPNEDDCNFKLKDLTKSSITNKRTINHKAVLEISCIAMIAGVFLFTGRLYIIVRKIINFAFALFYH